MSDLLVPEDKFVVLTRPLLFNKYLKNKLKLESINVYEFPTIKIVNKNLSNKEILLLQNLSSFGWIIFTSVNSVNIFIKELSLLEIDIRVIKSKKIGAIGPSTAMALRGYNINVTFEPSKFISTKIAEEIGDIKGAKILLPNANIASLELQIALKRKGANVENFHIYKTEYITKRDPELVRLVKAGYISYITFTSSSTVNGFIKRINKDNLSDIIYDIAVVCIGPQTAKTAKRVGFKKIYIADEYTVKGILYKLVDLIHE